VNAEERQQAELARQVRKWQRAAARGREVTDTDRGDVTDTTASKGNETYHLLDEDEIARLLDTNYREQRGLQVYWKDLEFGAEARAEGAERQAHQDRTLDKLDRLLADGYAAAPAEGAERQARDEQVLELLTRLLPDGDRWLEEWKAELSCLAPIDRRELARELLAGAASMAMTLYRGKLRPAR
jgi:hypothetical protein